MRIPFSIEYKEQGNTLFTAFFIYLVDFECRRINKNKD